MEDPELKPCPFCGGKENERFGLLLKPAPLGHWAIKCYGCKILMVHERKDKVIGIWNQRYEADNEQHEINPQTGY